MDIAMHVYELNGYLKMLGRLCRRHCDFSASVIDPSDNLDAAVKSYIEGVPGFVVLGTAKKVGHEGFKEVLDQYIYSNLKFSDEELVKVFDWDINEYLGLISITPDGRGEFYPVQKGAMQFYVESNVHNSFTVLVVECGEAVVLLALGVRKVEGEK